MEVTLILAGVPKGEDFYGPYEDRSYYSTFYTGAKSEEGRFMVEVRQSGSKTFCYYNLLKFNTVDSEKRSGGFFCLSLRSDVFFKDVVKMYNFLDSIFNKHVLNKMLISSANSLCYSITNFESKQQEIKNMEKSLVDMITLSFTNDDVALIDQSFNLKKTSGIEVNFSDCYRDNVLEAIKKYASISFSNTAPMAREKNAQQRYESNLSAALASKEQELQQRQSELALTQDKNKSLQGTIGQKEAEIQTLREQLKAKEAELHKHAQRVEIRQVVNDIKEPIARLANYIGATAQSSRQETHITQQENKDERSLSKSICQVLLPILNFVAILGIGGYMYYSSSHSPYVPDYTSRFESLEAKISEFFKVNDTSFQDDPVVQAQNNEKEEPASVKWEIVTASKIDISNSRTGNKCLVNETYEVTCKVDRQATGTVKDSNGRILSQTSSESGKISFTATEPGEVTIYFQKENIGYKRIVIIQNNE